MESRETIPTIAASHIIIIIIIINNPARQKRHRVGGSFLSRGKSMPHWKMKWLPGRRHVSSEDDGNCCKSFFISLHCLRCGAWVRI